jgi:hypothetical protein
LLGAAETVVGLSDDFRPHGEKRGLYVASAAAPAAPLRLIPRAVAPVSASAS